MHQVVGLMPTVFRIFLAPAFVLIETKMRTLILLALCIGIGYGIAIAQFQRRTSDVKNILGSEADMNGAIAKAKVSETKPGKIEVIGGNEFDFGTMMLGTGRSHSFVFRNVGQTPVDVVYKTASCKCTVGKLDAKKLMPGEQTEVELDWVAEGSISDFAQTATISTSAIDQDEIKLTIKGRISQAHVFDPPQIDFREFLAASSHEQTGRLYSFADTPLEIQKADWSESKLADRILCELSEPKKLTKGEVPAFADARYVVDFKVKLMVGVPAGPFSGNMVFFKKAAKEGEAIQQLNLPIQGRSVSPIRVIGGADYNEERNILDLGAGKSSVGLKKSLVIAIKGEDAKDIQVSLDEITPKGAAEVLKVTITEVKTAAKQKMFSITVEAPPGSAPTEFAGTHGKDFAKIYLKTNMESAPQLPMYIKFRIVE